MGETQKKLLAPGFDLFQFVGPRTNTRQGLPSKHNVLPSPLINTNVRFLPWVYVIKAVAAASVFRFPQHSEEIIVNSGVGSCPGVPSV